MDKAGGYGIQGAGSSFVARLQGCYFNVMGLPVHKLCSQLRPWIVAWKEQEESESAA